jgi:hypothetical protein
VAAGGNRAGEGGVAPEPTGGEPRRCHRLQPISSTRRSSPTALLLGRRPLTRRARAADSMDVGSGAQWRSMPRERAIAGCRRARHFGCVE